jgi:malate dehydrogenase (oxaloacetate-decarboxylating)
MKLVVSGAGAAGIACTKALKEFGFANIVVCDRKGAIHAGRDVGDNESKAWLAANTNPNDERGALKDVIAGADMFLGVSAPGLVDRADIERMQREPIVFSMANPDPEVMPEEIQGVAAVLQPAAATTPTRSTTYWHFLACSEAPSTPAPTRSTRR